jgi:hypothetical protein
MSPFQRLENVWEDSKMLSFNDANLLLSETIDQLQEELRNYARKPDAKAGFVEKQNKFISKLTDIYNGIQIPNADVLQILGKKIIEMKQIDPYIQGFTVYITEKPTGNMARIDLNLCAL